MDSATLKKVEKLATAIDWKDAFRGRSKGNKHLSRVIKIAIYLARAEGADLSVVKPAAWLHDSALPSGDDYQYTKNKRIAMGLLAKLKIEKSEAANIAECIASHEGVVTPKTLEAKVVHDADVIEKCGLLGLVRHTWKTVHRTSVPRECLSSREVDEIIKHVAWRQKRLQTNTARRISARLTKGMSKALARRVIALTIPLAAKDIITERIVLTISPQLSHAAAKRLSEQLSLSYLPKLKKI
jgi:HD superfamily phosphodiesterase